MRNGWERDYADPMCWRHTDGACVVKDDPIARKRPVGLPWAAWWTPHGKAPDGFFRTAREAMQACEQAEDAADA